MRIAILNWRDLDHPEAGGSERLVHEQANGLVHRGHGVTLFTSSHRSRGGVSELREYETVHLGGRYSVYPRVASWFGKDRRRSQFDVVLEHVNGVPWFSPIWSGLPCATYLYHPVRRTFFEELPFPISAVGYGIENVMPFFYRGVRSACLTESGRSEFESLGFSREQTTVVAPGVNQNPAGKRTDPPSDVEFLCLGPVKWYKRHDLVIKAFSRVKERMPSAKLSITGWERGGRIERLKALSTTLGVREDVTFWGDLSEADKATVIGRCWGIVYASEREGFGLGVLEAAVAGAPALVPDIPGLRDTVANEETGLIYPPQQSNALAESMLRLGRDPKLRALLGRNAQTRALSYTWERHALLMERELEAAIRSN
jgi:glycosyltransferase involved in cell wall biosynthesis